VVNMSFFVDDDAFQESTEFKCTSDPTQRSFREAVERALRYAVRRGVTPVAALGNSDQDLANPKDENGNPISNECEVVPAESPGVIGTTSLGNASQKATYSNYGFGEADVAAPGGMAPSDVQFRLQATAVDIGLPGYDECFGHGRINAFRAVTNDRSLVRDASAPYCPEYTE
jgi:hypothetical protein